MRGLKSYGRDRCTLHKKHLEDFKEWLDGQDGWQIQPPTGNKYEVLYAIKNSRSGPETRSFIYRNDHNEHLTVQDDLVPYMKRWFKERKKDAKPM